MLALAICSVLAAGCLSDVADESPTPESTRTPEATRTPLPALTTPTATVTLPGPDTIPTPVRTPRPVATPSGTTGLAGLDGEVEYDARCLASLDASPAPPGAPSPTALPESSPPLTATADPRLGMFPGPYEPVEFVPDATLQALLDTAVGARRDSYAFFVKDLSTGRGAVLNGGQVFNAASIFKLFVMYEVFRQEAVGLIDWDDELVVTPYYDGFALSPRVTELCQVVTVAEAMDAMLSVSDNAAAVLLQDLARSGNVNAAIEALGLTGSGLFPEGLPVTADDLGLLMEAIATGNAITPEASADMLRLLDHDVFENGLGSGLPEGVGVSQKTGNWADATNVAGVVHAEFGPYVFVALTSNGYERDVIEALSRAAYAYFEATSAQTAP